MMQPYPGRHVDGTKILLYINHFPPPPLIFVEDKAIFNYRLRRARRVIENSFGILAYRWWIFCIPIISKPDRVIVYSQAAIALQNYLQTTKSSVYCPPGFVDGEDGTGNVIDGSWWDNEDPCCLGTLPTQVICFYKLTTYSNFRYSQSAADVRDLYKHYYNSPAGEVCWQRSHVQQTN